MEMGVINMSKYNYISEEQFIEAEKNGISRNCVRQRVVTLRWDIEEAITKPIRTRRKNLSPVIINRLKKNGISRNLYHNRRRLGWTEEDASSTPPDVTIGRNAIEKEDL